MGLMDAKEYDPRPAQRRWTMVGVLAAIAVAALVIWWFYRYWPEEHVVNKFFDAIEHKDFDAAYGLYFADPDWKQHPEKYSRYTLNQFKLDWGPSSEYGTITTHKIDCATEPPTKDFQSPSGVIVVVIINGRSQVMLNGDTGPLSLWVEKKSKTITVSPSPVQCHPPK
jgi:hypothetical protein